MQCMYTPEIYLDASKAAAYGEEVIETLIPIFKMRLEKQSIKVKPDSGL